MDGDRQDAYGHPYEDFLCTAQVWSAMIRKKYNIDLCLQPEDVGLMMAGVKLIRECNQHKRDNLVDMAGYAKTVSMVHQRKDELENLENAVVL